MYVCIYFGCPGAAKIFIRYQLQQEIWRKQMPKRQIYTRRIKKTKNNIFGNNGCNMILFYAFVYFLYIVFVFFFYVNS